MNRVAGSRPHVPGGAWFWLGLCLLVPFTPSPASAQSSLGDLRDRYASARARLEAELRERGPSEREWQEALDSIDAARARGDDAARDRWYPLVYVRADNRDQAIIEEQAAREDLEAAGDALQNGILAEIDRLETAMDTASVGRLDEIDLLIEGLERELGDLQAEESEIPELVVIVQLRILPVDEPETILAKAELLELRAERRQSEIDDLADQIAELERRIRRQRSRETTRSNRERFDDVSGLVGTAGQVGSGADGRSTAAADSLGVPAARTPEERLAVLREVREDNIAYRNQLLFMARSWRELAGGTP